MKALEFASIAFFPKHVFAKLSENDHKVWCPLRSRQLVGKAECRLKLVVEEYNQLRDYDGLAIEADEKCDLPPRIGQPAMPAGYGEHVEHTHQGDHC